MPQEYVTLDCLVVFGPLILTFNHSVTNGELSKLSTRSIQRLIVSFHPIPGEMILSGRIIATSAEVTPNGGLVRESPKNPLNSGLGIILICPDPIWYYGCFNRKTKKLHPFSQRMCNSTQNNSEIEKGWNSPWEELLWTKSRPKLVRLAFKPSWSQKTVLTPGEINIAHENW